MKEEKPLKDQILVVREAEDMSVMLGIMFHDKCERQNWSHLGDGLFIVNDPSDVLGDTYFALIMKTLHDQFEMRRRPFQLMPEFTFMSAVCVPEKNDFLGSFRQDNQNLDFERKFLTCLYNVNVDSGLISEGSLQFKVGNEDDDGDAHEVSDTPTQITLFPSHLFRRSKVNTGENRCNLFRITLQIGLSINREDYERLFLTNHEPKTKRKGVSA